MANDSLQNAGARACEAAFCRNTRLEPYYIRKDTMPKVIATLLLIVSFARVASATDSTEGVTSSVVRIRPTDTQVADLLWHGYQRSATFRSLINRVEQRDVIVYIEMQPFGGWRLRGCLRWMTSTVGFRYVRVSLNPHQNKDALLESLAHELQHAIEVTEQVQIVDASTLVAFYRATGDQPRPGSASWDTPAAGDRQRGPSRACDRTRRQD